MTDPHSARPILIGTVHRNPRGRQLLTSLLEKLRPDALTLEVSPYAIEFRRRHGPLLRRRLSGILDRLAAETGRGRAGLAAHPEVAGIEALLELPFEYRAATDYATAAGIPLDLLDSSLVSARKLRRVEKELLSPENLRILLKRQAGSPPPESHAVARRLVLEGAGASVRQAFLAPRRGPEGIGPRDRHLAEEIRRRLVDLPGGRLAHIGGWVHLVADEQGETLYSLLRDWNPQRLLLQI
jgi:hypothetical protein